MDALDDIGRYEKAAQMQSLKAATAASEDGEDVEGGSMGRKKKKEAEDSVPLVQSEDEGDFKSRSSVARFELQN
jgi:hypothetical protein